MSINSDSLAAFLKVAETLSVSRAALSLGVAKSVVSKRVAQLEHTVQATLFSRSTRKVALTAAGEAYVEFARRALTEMGAGEERLRALRSELTGRIRITAPVSWGQRVLARRLPEFMRRHPAIEIECLLSDRMLDLGAERIDIALRWSANAPPQDLTHANVAPVGWLLAAAPQYLASAGRPSDPGALRGHSCLCYWRDGTDDDWTLVHAGQRAQVRVHSHYHVDNPEAVVEAACAGLGVALLPDYLCEQALAQGLLERVLPQWTPLTKFGTHISAVAAPERMRLLRNQMLLEFLRQPAVGAGV